MAGKPDRLKVIKSVLTKAERELEAEYARSRAKAAERLHEAFAEVIREQEADVQTVLYVLELIRFQVLFGKYQQLFGKVNAPADLPPEPEKEEG